MGLVVSHHYQLNNRLFAFAHFPSLFKPKWMLDEENCCGEELLRLPLTLV